MPVSSFAFSQNDKAKHLFMGGKLYTEIDN